MFLLVICGVCATTISQAQWDASPGLQETFDSDQPSWEMLYIDPGGTFTDRARDPDVAVSGKSETYQCRFVGQGIYFIGHQILLPYMIEDLNADVWVRSQETDIVCALEVVLPKSTTKDGKPVTLLLPGDQYKNRGEWRQLRIKADLRELENQAKSLRLELGVPIDTTQAYVRRLILCCYTTQKTSRIWLDDLHVRGIATVSRQIRAECEAEPVFNPQNVLWMFREIGLYSDLTPGVRANVEARAIPIINWTASQRQTPSLHSDQVDQAARIVPQEILAEVQNFQRQHGSQNIAQTCNGFFLPQENRFQWVPNHPIMMVSSEENHGRTTQAGFFNTPDDTTASPIVNAAGTIPQNSGMRHPGMPATPNTPSNMLPNMLPNTLPNNRHITGMPQGMSPGQTQYGGFNSTQPSDVIAGTGTTRILPNESVIAASASFDQRFPTAAGMSNMGTSNERTGDRATDLRSMLSERPDLYRAPNAGEFPEHVLQDRISRGKPHDGCRITAQQKKIMINGDLPYAVRAVEYRGEPLAFLADLQFNTIWLRQPPTEQLLEEAWKLGLWVICPPPDENTLQQFVNFVNTTGMTEDGKSRADGSDLRILGRMFARNRNPILAWDVGRHLTQGQYEQMQRYVQLVQSADVFRRIPVICSTDSGTRDYSRMVNIILLERDPILSSLEMSDYNTWLGTKVGWGRGITPHWCAIQTQPSPEMAHQWRLFGVDEIPPTAVSEEHVRLQIRAAMANECHGLLFTSHSRLDATDPETKYRAALLELVNMELLLIEGWLSTGDPSQTVRSSVSGVGGVLLTTDRAKLLLANIVKPFGQYVMGNTNCNDVDFLMPGNFETHQANHIIPGGTRPLKLQRITGGVHIHFDEVNTSTAAFFAQDAPILKAILPRSRQTDLSRRSSELAIELAKMRLEQVRKTIRAFQEIQASEGGLPYLKKDDIYLPIITMPEQESMLRETERAISTAESYHRQADYSSSYQQAQRSIAGLQYYERLKWEEAIRNVQHHNMIPTAVSFVTLPAYIETIKKMTRMKYGENRLPTGDGENAQQWQQARWHSFSSPTEGVTPIVSVGNARAARSGQGGIQLMLVPTNQLAQNAPAIGGTVGVPATFVSESTADENAALQLETAAVWIRTPQIPVYAGETICITGYVNIPQKLQGNVDGLMIFDSLGGEPLALRFTETNDQWRQFVCYRAVPKAVPPQASMCVTFALCGIGEVRLDDIQIFPIVPDPNAPKSAPETQPSGSGWPQLPQLPRIDQMFRSGEYRGGEKQ